VVTANHYWIDAAGGALILGLGYLAGRWWDGVRQPAPAPPDFGEQMAAGRRSTAGSVRDAHG
jgi:hypothetical protein